MQESEEGPAQDLMEEVADQEENEKQAVVCCLQQMTGQQKAEGALEKQEECSEQDQLARCFGLAEE